MANKNFDHRAVVKSNWPELLKRIDTNTGLQGELKKCTREFPAMFIRSVWDNRDTTVRTDKLLTHLMNGGKARFDWFCDSLCMSGQHTIVDAYLKPQPAVPLDDQLDAVPVVVQTTAAASPATSATTCRQGSDEFLRADSLNNLRKHWNELYGDIRSDHEFLGELVSRLVFTEMQIKKLKDTDQEMDRNDLMLHWLEKGSQATFIGFCEALTITKQDQLRRSLMPTADARTVSSNIFNTTDVSDDTAAASSAADVSVPAESTAVEESTATESAGSFAVEESARSSAVEESAESSAIQESAATHIMSDEYKIRLMRNVAHCGLKIKTDVPGDGNCFFHCIRDQLLRFDNSGVNTSSELRQQLVAFMQNLDSTDPLADHLSSSYINEMAQDGTWVNHVAVQATARMIEKDLIIVTSMESSSSGYLKNVIPGGINGSRVCTDDSSCLLLGHVGEYHYVSLQPLDAQYLQGTAMPCTEAPELNHHARRITAYVYQSADQVTDDQFIQEVIDKIRSEKAYEIKLSLSGNRGRAVIINNINFKNAIDADRKGAEVDEKNLKALFVHLKYEVVVHRNKTIKEIENILEEERKHEDQKLADSFVLFVLSHGEKEIIYGTDHKSISLKKIMKYFNGKNCPDLIKKPKLFFVQACQGKRLSTGLPCTQTDAMPDEFHRQMESINLHGNEAESGDNPDVLSEMSTATLVHEESDRVLIVSTVEDYASLRCEADGSIFVQSVYEVFMKRAGCTDFLNMLTEMNKDMSRRVTEYKGKKCVPISETKYYTLNGSVYLLPADMLQRFHDKCYMPAL